MNALMTYYKKIVVITMVMLTMSINAVISEKCKPCAAAAAAHAAKINAANAAKLSIQAAHAASLAAGNKPSTGKPSRESELSSIDNIKIEHSNGPERCAACEAAHQQSLAEELAASLDAVDQAAGIAPEDVEA